MFGNWFYHKRVRTAVSVFGSMFNNLYVLREKSDGSILSQVKVPLSYAPKRNFIQRLAEMSKGEEAERRVAIKLPRMSFEINNISYDAERQLPKVNQFQTPAIEDDQKRIKMYTSVPYDISFTLSIYAKTQDDALQIVEQVLPYFTPQYTVTVTPFGNDLDIKEDVPIVLTGVSFEDTYEGPLEQRRTIVYDLTFDMKMSFYGPKEEYGVIRNVNNNFYLIDDSDTFIQNLQISPDPIDVNPDSDYGFNIRFTDSEEPTGL